MSKEKDNRITIRTTKQMQVKIQDSMKTGRWMKQSDLIREALWIGLKELEGRSSYGNHPV